MKKIIIYLLLSSTFPLAVNAEVISDELEELEPKTTSSVLIPTAKSIQVIKKEHIFSAYYLPSTTSFNQDGEGQNYSTENGNGQGAYLTLSNELREFQNQLDFNLMYQRSQFTEPDDIGGDNIQTSRLLLNSTYNWKFINKKNTFLIGAGATLQLETADKFSENNKLMTNNISLGPSAFLKWGHQLSDRFSIGAQALLSIPLYIQEYGKETGYYKNGYHLLAGILFNFFISKNLSLSIGLLSENQERSFEGEGERGVTDGVLSYTSVSFPVGVMYEF
jgi:hypothetical protein